MGVAQNSTAKEKFLARFRRLMVSKKTPPPDTIGNLQGRIAALKSAGHRNAAMEAKQGGDYDKVLAKWEKETAPLLRSFERRLACLEKGKPPALVKGAQGGPEKPKKRSATRVPSDYQDLLDKLDSL